MSRARRLVLPCVAALLAAGCRPASAPVIVVETAYPGADAATVLDTVARPIEQQVTGVEGAIFLRSRCSSDGRYVLTVALAKGTDAAMAQVLVQNRVALAIPLLPDAVQAGGVTARKRAADVALLVALSSPGGRFDATYLDNYAAVQLREEVARLAGVGAVVQVPEPEGTLRVWLDPDRLARYGLTARDVALALQNQGLQCERMPAAADKPARIEVKLLGRLVNPAQLDEAVVHAAAGGQVVRVKDIGHAEGLARSQAGAARLNGKDVALLAVAPLGAAPTSELKTGLTRRVAELADRLPEGLRLELAFDFTPNLASPGRRTVPEYLLLDVDLPADAAPDRADAVLRDIAQALGQTGEITDILALTDNPFDGTRETPCVLLRLSPASERKASRQQVADAVRAALRDKVPGAAVRVRFPLGPGPLAGWGYPLHVAVHGPDAASVASLAAKLADKLSRQAELTDVRLDPATQPRPRLSVSVDRESAARHGVRVADIYAALLVERRQGPPARQAEEIKQLKVRNDQGAMVPLTNMVRAEVTEAPTALDRFDGKPMQALTANPAPDVAPDRARALCEQVFGEVRTELRLPAEYRLSGLGGER